MLDARERVLKALNHEEPDRVPIADVIANTEVIEYYAGEKLTPKNAEDLTCKAIGKTVDFARHFTVPNMEPRIVRDEDGFVYRLEWWTGQCLERPFKDTRGLTEIVKKDIDRIYNAIDKGKLCPQATLHVQLTGEEFQTPEELHEYFARVINKMDGSFLLAPESLVGLHTAYYRAGFELFVYLYNENPKLVSEWLQALNDYEIFRINRIADPKLMPVALVGDDLAYNKGLLFSREFLLKESLPRAKRLVDAWHAHGCKVIFFCDGNKWDIMDDIAAMGCDCFGPLEPASNMFVKDVKEEYPQLAICYSVDCNDLLSYGTPEQVEVEVKRQIDDGNSGGGFVLASTSSIHPGVKLENVITMFETAKTYGTYDKLPEATVSPTQKVVQISKPVTSFPQEDFADPAIASDDDQSVLDIKEAVISGDWRGIDVLVSHAISQGIGIHVIMEDGLSSAMNEVGDLFSEGTYFIPDLILSGRAMKAGIEVLKPHFKIQGAKPKGSVVIGSIQGDIHDIGKNLVITMLEGGGYQVVDLGVDVKADQFIKAVQEYSPDIVAMSGILTTTAMNMPLVVQALEEADLRQEVLVAMGGTCVTPKFAEDSGADIYAADAASAVNEFNQALKNRRQR